MSHEKTIIFPAMGLQHFSHGALKALWHRVLATHRTQTECRYSMVAFIDFFHDYRYDKSRKRLQDLDPGFNYRMPFVEFNKLFVGI